MSIEYAVIPNALTVPPSYTARPAPKTILDYDLLARAINESNPTIPEQTAKSVLEAFKAEVVLQLSEGNTINLVGFVSFVVSMPIRLDSPTDLLPTNPIDVKAKPSIVLKTAVRQQATYNRLAFQEKQPSILLGYDANTNIQNWTREGYGLRVDGSNVGFDGSDAEQGVYLLSSAGNNIKQSNIALNDPSKLIVTPVFDAASGPAGTASVEQILSVKARYTTNGQIRTGTYAKPLRSTNVISDATSDQVFVVGNAITGPAEVSSYVGTQVNARIVAQIRPDNVLTLSVGELEGDLGQALEVSANATVVLTGLAAAVSIEVTDYATLYASVLSYGRYMQEVCDLSPLTP